MIINEGRTDRLARGAVGAVLVAGALLVGATEAAGIVMLVVAGVLLLTAATGFCPLYRLLGISTAPRERSAAPGRPGAAAR